MIEVKKIKRKITVLGATGSIGTQAMDVVRESQGSLTVHALAAKGSVDKLASKVLEFRPARVAMADPTAARELEQRLGGLLGAEGPEVLAGEDGVLELASAGDSDVVLNSLVGSSGLMPTLASLDSGVTLALANKESLVMAGQLVMEKARDQGALVPVDSEHSSLFRCMLSSDASGLRSITVTASGGAFRGWSLDRMKGVTPEQALRHPVWNMGVRVTIDSATMMNKSLEIIEAQHLFNVDPSKIHVAIHPQAYVHGLIELSDGTLLAHLGQPDMRVAIAYALYYPAPSPPERKTLDVAGVGALEFERPDHDRFPCLRLGYRAAEEGGTSPAVLNAADEVAVDAFLKGRIDFTDIPEIVRRVMDEHSTETVEFPEQVLKVDRWAREKALSLIEG